jgi:predicted ATPase
MEESWRITLFGGLTALQGERTVSRFETRKAAQLLGFLALSPGKSFSREALADRFWGDDTPVTARQNLRAALAALRRTLGEHVFLSGRDSLGLSRSAVTTDLEEFETLLDRAVHASGGSRLDLLERATTLATGELLDGDDQLAAHGERARLNTRLCQALRQRASLLREHGDEDGARACLLRLVALDPDAPELEKPRVFAMERIIRPAGLPRALSTFIGRAEERSLLTGLLDPDEPTPLITVLGPGGMGKTRLCLEAARVAQPRFARVAFVTLVDLMDTDGLYPAIATALGVPWERSENALLRLAEAISLPTLLVLDNAEPLLPALALPVASLLERAPLLKILTSSRERLGIDGEYTLLLGPLTVLESQTLLRDRAQLRQLDENEKELATLAGRLDGLPLALELAAARLKIYSPAELSEQLRLDLLTTRDTTRPWRHRTMRAAIAGSYDRLETAEQAFFRALSVLRGSWSVAAAAAVTGCDTATARLFLERLLETALLTPAPSLSGERRFRLLEPLREFGDECRTEDETQMVRLRHALYFLTLGEEIERHLSDDYQGSYFRLDADEANIDAALVFGLHQTADLLIRAWRLATRLRWTWWVRGKALSCTVLDIDARFLAQSDTFQGVHPDAYAEARLIQAQRGGDAGAIAAALEYQRTILLTLERPIDAAIALEQLGNLEAERGDLEKATWCIRQAAQECEAAGDPRRATWMLASLASSYLRMAPLSDWEKLARECQGRSRQFEGEDATAVWDREFGWQAYLRHDFDGARECFRSAVEKFYRRGEWRLQAHALTLLGLVQKTIDLPPDAWHQAQHLYAYLGDAGTSQILERRLAGEDFPLSPWPTGISGN